MPHSALSMGAISGGQYLQHGLWMVRPYADPTRYAYGQTLPLHYCLDKVRLRIYAHARRLPESIYSPEVNENFRDVIIANYLRLKEAITFMLDPSVLARHGLIEARPLCNA